MIFLKYWVYKLKNSVFKRGEFKKMNDIINNIELFKNLDINIKKRLALFLRIEEYKKNNIIFMEGEVGKGVYFVIEGRIRLFKTSYEGKEVTINIISEGSTFAEVTMFSGFNYPVTAMSMERSKVAYISNNDLEKLIVEDGKLALSLIKDLNQKLYTSQFRVKEMALDNVNSRLCKYLMDLSLKYGKKKNNYIEININVSKSEIGNIIGASRETVSRVLTDLKNEDIIEIKGKKIIIMSLESLENMCN